MQEVAALSERSSYNSAQHRRQHLSSFTSLLAFVATMKPPPLSLIFLLARADDGQSILLDLLQVQGLHYQHLWKTTR